MDDPSEPRALANAGCRAVRKGLLCRPQIKPLSNYVEQLRAQGRGIVPDFDPLDGGVEAKALFLFEKPGPMTDEITDRKKAGSGFISRDNDDPTAEATFRFMVEAGIARRLTVIWNIVPWWNGTRRISASELRDGVAALDGLVALLPYLKVIMLVGRKAARARSLLDGRSAHVFECAHPSPIVRASRPDLWSSIPDRWARIQPLLS